jgi:hypothetical protein
LSAVCDNVTLVTYEDRSTLLMVTLALFNINVAMF